MKQLFIILCVITITTFSCDKEKKGEIKLVTPEEMEVLLELDDIQLVDVRTPDEHNEEHIINSQNIDFNSPNFEEEIKYLDKTKPVILYCKSGKRSAKCGKKLIEAGFVKIYDLEGGISKWKHKGKKIKIKT